MKDDKEKEAAIVAVYGENPDIEGKRVHWDIREAVEASPKAKPSILDTDQSRIFLTADYWAYVNKVLDLVTKASPSSFQVITPRES